MKKTFKIAVLFCLVISMLLSAVACKQTPPAQGTTETTETSQIPEEPQKTYQELYADIISQYTTLLTAKQKEETLVAPNTDGMGENQTAIMQAVYEVVRGIPDAKNAALYGYGYRDYDGNGVPELILFTKYLSVKAIFTIDGDAPILLSAHGDGNPNIFFANSHILFARGNRFLTMHKQESGSLREFTYSSFHIEGAQIVYETVYGQVYDNEKYEVVENFQMLDGKRTAIDDDTFAELYWEYSTLADGIIQVTFKLQAPYLHLPLEEKSEDKSLPVVDFSSYAAIRETVKAISDCVTEFDSNDWENGVYDDLFTFPNDTAFEYYLRLLYVLHWDSGSPIGYDEIDLNGDGKDELLLLSEDCTIEAVFTQKDGVPVLLESSLLGEEMWLDEERHIHIDSWNVYETENSVYEVTKNGEFRLLYALFLNQKGHRYLIRDGKIEKITYAEQVEIFEDDYICYPPYLTPNEYSRTVTDLTYTPLYANDEDLYQKAVGKTWYKFTNWDDGTEKEWETAFTYVTFENATDDRTDVHFQYVLTSYYPLPDNESYLGSTTTESSMMMIARKENGAFVFDTGAIEGRIEFGDEYLWVIIEESTDERFPVGYHCFEVDLPEEIPPV